MIKDSGDLYQNEETYHNMAGNLYQNTVANSWVGVEGSGNVLDRLESKATVLTISLYAEKNVGSVRYEPQRMATS